MPYLQAVLVGGWQAGGCGRGGGVETMHMAVAMLPACLAGWLAGWLEEDSERAWACTPTDAQGFSLACFLLQLQKGPDRAHLLLLFLI